MQSRVLAIIIAVVLALVATAALVVYVNGADRRAISGQDPVQVLVAARDIPAGTSGGTVVNVEGWITETLVPRKNAVEGSVRSKAQLQDRFAEVNIVKGEQLLLSRWVGAEDVAGRGLLPIPERHQALSIGLDLTRQVAGFVTPGDNVSLILSMQRGGQSGGEGEDRSEFLLQNIRVLAVGATALANANTQGGAGRVNQGRGGQNLTAITLAVPQQHVERVVFAAENGSIYLSLMPRNAEDAPRTGGVTGRNVIPGGP
jgi:pilus assembly protein CpaB